MTITLSPETQKLLEERMKTGGFQTADDALRAALQQFYDIDEDDRSPETEAAIRRGLADAEAGRTVLWDDFKKDWLATKSER